MGLIIKGARVIDPSSGTDAVLDILIRGEKIEKIAPGIATSEDIPVLDATGLTAAPGLIDMHCHLREPGFEYKEDIFSGTRSAALGGFTAVACMPNTRPVADNGATVCYILNQARASGASKVLPIGAVTQGQLGERLTDFQELKTAGCVAVSDDGRPVPSARIAKSALIEAGRLGMPLIAHCEDLSLTDGGAINEGAVSAKLGLKGVPRSAEEIMTAREILLAAETGVSVHIAHVSTARSVAMIRQAKAAGIPVTCETCPHYFSLTEEAVLTRGANAKMSPPLRTKADVDAVIKGLADDTIDVIATDHAPHSKEEKNARLADAPNGIVGFETALSAGITFLFDKGHLSLSRLIEKMTTAPARIVAPALGRLSPGDYADIVLFDLNGEYTVDANAFASKSANSPYDGMTLKGVVKYTFVNGKRIVDNGKL